jgi:hypothetical protein
VAWLIVSDGDWEKLTAMFAGLRGGRVDERGRVVYRSEEEIRRMFNLGLPSSPLSENEKTRFRTIVRERVRAVDGDVKFNDPYFELEWLRVTQEDPSLLNDSVNNREMLWNAFYAREAIKRNTWRKMWIQKLGRPMSNQEVDYGDT